MAQVLGTAPGPTLLGCAGTWGGKTPARPSSSATVATTTTPGSGRPSPRIGTAGKTGTNDRRPVFAGGVITSGQRMQQLAAFLQASNRCRSFTQATFRRLPLDNTRAA